MSAVNFQQEWDAVKVAPFLSLGVIILVGLGLWAFVHFLYKARNERLKQDVQSEQAEVARLRARLAEFDKKLEGASPDEAQSQIEALRDEVAKLRRQRRLTPEQRNAIKDTINKVDYPGKVLELIYPQPSLESATFAYEIAETLTEAGWPATYADFTIGPQRLTKKGLSIAVHDLADRGDRALALARAFDAAGVKYCWEQLSGTQPPGRLYVDLADDD